ncbi:MAG TPA: hypothetical protein VHD62_13840 [Opitutaceae bacterium]|nr:hypothetical protein [Opitutaceae bacterium]
MKPSRPRSHAALAFLGAIAAAGLVGGCNNIFRNHYNVLVDAICAPGTTKPSGKSYRLVAKRSVVSSTPVQIPVIKACVDAALASAGMFEPPPNVPPDLVIEVTYGRDSAPRMDPATRETFLQLSARTNPEGALDKATGPEIWDVKASLLGVNGPVEAAMPMLASVAVEHIATDTSRETHIDVPQNSPTVEAIRQAALKALDKASAAATSSAPAAAPPAPRS